MNHQLILNEPIADGLHVIGDRWTMLILREAFYGCSRFDEFCKRISISRATLTRRLRSLIDNDILIKSPLKQAAKRFEYKFTTRGLGLLGSSLLGIQWEADWRKDNSRQVSVIQRLVHTVCGHKLQPKAVCRACHQDVSSDDVSWLDLSEHFDTQLQEIRASNAKHRKRLPNVENANTDNDPGLVSLVGDRWTILILISCFFNTRKYDSFVRQLNIPSGILADRLKFLSAARVLKRVAYQQKPVRYEYRLTRKGKSLFPFIMSLRQWVMEQMLSFAPQTNRLVHNSCGHALALQVVCNGCGQAPCINELEVSPK